MRVSKKTDYALRALLSLVDGCNGPPIPIRRLAEKNSIPKRFLEQIMLELKSQGWATSLPGKTGGYLLGNNPDRITLGEIVRHFDGVLAPIGCVSVTGYEPCDQEETCRFREVFMEIRDHTARLMDRITLVDVAKGNPLATVSDMEKAFLERIGK